MSILFLTDFVVVFDLMYGRRITVATSVYNDRRSSGSSLGSGVRYVEGLMLNSN